MVTRFCTSKIHSYLRKRDFLNQLKAVQDGNEGLMPKLQPPHNQSSPLKIGCATCRAVSRPCPDAVPHQPNRGSPFTGGTPAPSRSSTFGRGSQGVVGGLWEYWERVWGPVCGLGGPADVTPSPPSGSRWSEHTENSLLQLCKLFSLNCNMPTAPDSSSKSPVSLAIFRGK